jgi:dTDP-4-dehydrorhamnose 3,5-epimerase
MGREVRDRDTRDEDHFVKFRRTDIADVVLVEPEPKADERGFFARLYCPDEFAAAKIDFTPLQVSLSRNQHMHTLRGMHFQNPPYAEAKLVHVTRGVAYDVIVDLRKDSATFGRWAAFELSAESARAVFIPQGCAHGFLTLAPETDVLYHIDRLQVGGQGRGYRWNDPAFGIRWPAEPAVISGADRAWPDFSPGGNS